MKYLDVPFSEKALSRMWVMARVYAKSRVIGTYSDGWRREKAEAEMALAEFARLSEQRPTDTAARLAETYGATP